jgi:cytochrome P450
MPEPNSLADLALFEGCSPDELSGLTSSLRDVRTVIDGDVICTEGSVADRWWIIMEGTAAVTLAGLFVAEIGAGESFGEMALIEGRPCGATVTATSDMVLQEVDGSRFVENLLENPSVMLALLRETTGRLRRANENAERPAPAPSHPRVAPRRPPPGGRGETLVDPRDPDFLADPYPYYDLLRAKDPVHFDPAIDGFILTRYADVHRLVRDRSLAVDVSRAYSTQAVDAEVARNRIGGGHLHQMMLRRDGEDHSRLRGLVAKAFTPKAISSWRDRTQADVDELITSLAERSEADIIADFALPLPALIISAMLGMPAGDIPQLRAWSVAITKTFDPLNAPEEEAESIEAGRALSRYVEDVVREKRASLSEDILSQLIQAEISGDRLTLEELVSQVTLLYIAGHENTLNLIGNGLVHLLGYPEQLDRLRGDRGLEANAIEELIRFDSPVQYTRRIALGPVKIDDVLIPEGSVMLLCLGGANRDPDKWGADADVLDLARPRANEHASFGGGPHHCLGSALARLEAQVALPELVRRFPRMMPVYDEPMWARRMVIRGVETLPVTLGHNA